jgi:dienelactone hydrolase
MSGPHESVLPTEVVNLVSDWINLGPVGPVAAAPRGPTVMPALSAAGTRERPWAGQRDDGYRFGVLAEPRNARRRALGVLLLSGEVSHGPNRMWVESARRWAARGVPACRLEVAEDDPSAVDDRPYAREEKLYDHRYALQASDAVAELVRDGVADHWLVVGLCAGATWAFHAALRSPREISAAVLINPFAFDWEEELAIAATLGRARRRRLDTWKRVAAGRVDPARISAIASHAVRTPIQWRTRRRRAAARIQREVHHLDRLRADGTRLTFLVGQDEPFIDRLRDEGLLDELGRWPNITLHRLPSRDHSFRSLNLQGFVHREIDAAINAELETLATASPPASCGRMSIPDSLVKPDLLR